MKEFPLQRQSGQDHAWNTTATACKMFINSVSFKTFHLIMVLDLEHYVPMEPFELRCFRSYDTDPPYEL